MELVWQNLEPHNAELRAEIRGALRHLHNSRKNINKEDVQALAELRKDQSGVILTADKGIVLVVMDRTEYNNKAQQLLEDGGTYKEIKINKPKNNLSACWRRLKQRGASLNTYIRIFMGYPKFDKWDIPLRPIVSSRGSINYEVAKRVRKNHMTFSRQFPPTISRTLVTVQQMKGITLQANECIASYDVSALFTFVLTEPAINIIRGKLELDQEFHLRTNMKVEQIISLLKFAYRPHISSSRVGSLNSFKEQLWGLPSAPLWPTSLWRPLRPWPLVQLSILPRIWKRYVDDTYMVIDSAKKEKFLEHINNINPCIEFTMEDAKADESIPFLDIVVMTQPDNTCLTSVYRKPTHTDLYLHWDSHHHLSAKFSVINILKYRAKTVWSNHHLLKEEEDHLNKALRRCKYPAWGPNRVNRKQNKNRTNQGTSRHENKKNSNKPYILVPYVQDMNESCKNIWRKHGVEIIFKGGNIINDLLVHPQR